MTTESTEFLNFAIKLAKEVGVMLKQAQIENTKFQTMQKRANDLVTLFDSQADKMIEEAIRATYPDHSIQSEESGDHYGKSTYRWIVDPIDGTKNFAHHIPMFAVSLALEHEGKPLVGVIYNPMNEELFTAEKGKGAFLNGERLSISGHDTISGALLGTGFPCKDPHDVPAYLHLFERLLRGSQGLRRIGAASIDLAYLAAGRLDGFWEFRLYPWDIAAAALMIQEAGGVLCDCLGGDDYPRKGVIAGSEEMVVALTEIIKPIWIGLEARY